jgi:hypothetical protein
VAAPPARVVLRIARHLPGPGRALLDDGRALRAHTWKSARDVAQVWLTVVVPALVDAVLDRLDLTGLVVDRVDLDRIAGQLDIDAVLDRVDLTDVVVYRVDLDRVVQELDIDALLDRLDLTDVVVHRVDLDRIVRELDIDAVLDRLDLTGLVVDRVDLDRIVRELDIDALLDRLDLTDVVVHRVDLDRIVGGLDVDAVVARVDLDAAVARVDLLALAEYVVDGIDLPKIVRESTGSVASEGLRQVRLTSVDADRALAQFVDRMMFRRNARRDGHVPPGDPGVDGPGA